MDFVPILAVGIIGLSTCSARNADSDVVAQTKAGDVTKEELYETRKDKYGEQALNSLRKGPCRKILSFKLRI